MGKTGWAGAGRAGPAVGTANADAATGAWGASEPAAAAAVVVENESTPGFDIAVVAAGSAAAVAAANAAVVDDDGGDTCANDDLPPAAPGVVASGELERAAESAVVSGEGDMESPCSDPASAAVAAFTKTRWGGAELLPVDPSPPLTLLTLETPTDFGDAGGIQ